MVLLFFFEASLLDLNLVLFSTLFLSFIQLCINLQRFLELSINQYIFYFWTLRFYIMKLLVSFYSSGSN